MDITYLGAGCIRLSGKQLDLLVDPYDESYGLGKVKASADASLFTSPEVKGEPVGMRLDGPGEYEIKGGMITGAPARLHIDETGERGTIYRVTVDGINVAVIGNVNPELSNDQVEALGQVDVLILPVGGHGLTLDADAAAAMVSRLEPKYVVPVHFDDGKTKYPMPQDNLDKFLSETGAKPEPMAKLKINGRDLPEETEVVVLARAGA